MCEVGREYPIDEDRLGYMHSFGLTENYVILPETSYIFKPCNVFSELIFDNTCRYINEYILMCTNKYEYIIRFYINRTHKMPLGWDSMLKGLVYLQNNKLKVTLM